MTRGGEKRKSEREKGVGNEVLGWVHTFAKEFGVVLLDADSSLGLIGADLTAKTTAKQSTAARMSDRWGMLVRAKGLCSKPCAISTA
jgi:hypothetical protein